MKNYFNITKDTLIGIIEIVSYLFRRTWYSLRVNLLSLEKENE